MSNRGSSAYKPNAVYVCVVMPFYIVLVSPLRAGDKGSTQAGTGRCLIVVGDRDLKARVAVKGARIEVRFTPQRDREKGGGWGGERQTDRQTDP